MHAHVHSWLAIACVLVSSLSLRTVPHIAWGRWDTSLPMVGCRKHFCDFQHLMHGAPPSPRLPRPPLRAVGLYAASVGCFCHVVYSMWTMFSA